MGICRLPFPRHPGVQTAWSFFSISPHPYGRAIRQNDPVVNIALVATLCTEPDCYHHQHSKPSVSFSLKQLLCFCACSFTQAVMGSQHQTGISALMSTERISPERKCAVHDHDAVQQEPLPRPCIFLGLLIDRTPNSAVLHGTLSRKVPLFLYKTTEHECVNKPGFHLHRGHFPVFSGLPKVKRAFSPEKQSGLINTTKAFHRAEWHQNSSEMFW